MKTTQHWAENPYWTEALDRFAKSQRKGKKRIVIDLQKLSEIVYNDDGPAYKLMDAMVSVKGLEGEDGYRGAPRVLLAMLVRLEELSRGENAVPVRVLDAS